MQKKDLVADLKSFAGSFFITRSQLAQFLNKKDPHNIDYLLSGLERVDKRYYVRDVADAILLARDVR